MAVSAAWAHIRLRDQQTSRSVRRAIPCHTLSEGPPGSQGVGFDPGRNSATVTLTTKPLRGQAITGQAISVRLHVPDYIRLQFVTVRRQEDREDQRRHGPAAVGTARRAPTRVNRNPPPRGLLWKLGGPAGAHDVRLASAASQTPCYTKHFSMKA
ncbi:hypothetical protein SKAU_G00383790 [Synaphobranchus kaupii]|uniref:Uncharacterized protein n=1 Tax=Synaphobranchus kaupii TaxID=118154 RepID=A0A9Q1EE60_SYNKA|nr:hypothetical protein SKAU_G00383790 [Synaphobranchus kaupii]